MWDVRTCPTEERQRLDIAFLLAKNDLQTAVPATGGSVSATAKQSGGGGYTFQSGSAFLLQSTGSFWAQYWGGVCVFPCANPSQPVTMNASPLRKLRGR